MYVNGAGRFLFDFQSLKHVADAGRRIADAKGLFHEVVY